MNAPLKLSPSEEALFAVLEAGDDVEIKQLYKLVKRDPSPNPTMRERQTYLGPFIVRLNKKLSPRKRRVVPGYARATYRLKRINA